MGRLSCCCCFLILVPGLLLTVTLGGDAEVSQLQVKPSIATLRLVHMLFRHGDRTPVKPYPNDPYRDVKRWPVSWGQLTNEGKRRQFKLGQFNRARYENFLSPHYSPEEVYIRSTDVDRTLMSAEAHLAGLFPPRDNQSWNDELAWQPIPIHTVPKEEDLLLMLESNCSRYDELLDELNASPVVRDVMESHRPLLDLLANSSGQAMRTIDDVEYLYDTLFIEDKYNMTLPKWTKDVFPAKLKELSDFSFAMKAYTPAMQRLRGGPWVKEVADNLRNYSLTTTTPHVNGTPRVNWTRKLMMYSGHDVSLATVLSALKVFNNIQPPYASMVLVELHELHPKDLYVQVLYKNVSDDGIDPFPLTLPGCPSDICPLETFFQVIHNVTSEDVLSECNPMPVPSTYNPVLVISLLAGTCVVLLLGWLSSCAIWVRRSRMNDGHAYSAIQAE